MTELEERYARQIRLPGVGLEGQRRLAASSVLVLGCGALGSNLANLLVRAGVGRVRIVDRDLLELNNLQRQVLFDEEDVAARLPKAEAAARKLRRINSGVAIEALVADVTPRSVERIADGMDLVVDGTDNLETRYLVNDACVKASRPWIYGGVIGTTGMSLTVLPRVGPCLRCLFPTPPPAGSLPTCESAGVLGALPALIAAVEAAEALKLLVGAPPSTQLLAVNLWPPSFQQVTVLRDEECPTCGLGRHDFLETRETAWVATLCGRDAIQITPARPTTLPLEELREALAASGRVTYNGFLLHLVLEDGKHEIVLFPDGRALIKGTTDEALARSLYARHVGT